MIYKHGGDMEGVRKALKRVVFPSTYIIYIDDINY